LQAIVRLLESLRDLMDREVVGPAAVEEILYPEAAHEPQHGHLGPPRQPELELGLQLRLLRLARQLLERVARGERGGRAGQRIRTVFDA